MFNEMTNEKKRKKKQKKGIDLSLTDTGYTKTFVRLMWKKKRNILDVTYNCID